MPINVGPDHLVWAHFPALMSRGKDGTMSKEPTGHEPSAEALLQKTFALNLRAARTRKHMTQAKVSEAIGVSQQVYWRYESARTWPNLDTLRDICKVLEVSADTLLGFEHGQMPSALQLPTDDPPMVRRLLGQLRQASRNTLRLVTMLLAEVERRRGGKS